MIDFQRIKQEPTAQRFFFELLANVLQLLLMVYGLKCMLTLRGHMLVRVQGEVYWHFRLEPITGTLAAITGLLCFSFGFFLFLSDGPPPREDFSWARRLGRALLRWGSLAMAIYCFVKTQALTGHGIDLSGLPWQFELKLVGFILGFPALLLWLAAMYQREQVKKDLSTRQGRPLHIWWRPAAYWVCRYWAWRWGPTGFRVIYADRAGFVHKGYCYVYRSFQTDPNWGRFRVVWLADTLTGQLPLPEVWVHDPNA
ncbi:MAG TPA: hypothetical protein VGV18_06690 [Verrucomicrobiae bacterium]|nr:hypothetical protein [Verrucomicrobiae bacterium]